SDNSPLHAPSTSTSGGNGVYAYGSSSTFPNNTFNASNYWVDVVLSTSPSPSPTPQTCPCSLFGATATPANISSDSSALELGVKFRADVAGRVTGARFYKASGNTGTHVANLWTSSGTLLATATFSNETSSGWQSVIFATPVQIQANTVYVISYHTNTGNY